jgi:chromosome segregation ATPase
MPTWVIYMLAGLAIVTTISGGYLWLNHTLSEKDKEITELQKQIAADQIDISRYKTALELANTAIEKTKQSLRESQAQALRIKQADAEERNKVLEFQRQVEGIKSQDDISLYKINQYQICVAKDISNSECGKLLQ